jgi:hypothetical protein
VKLSDLKPLRDFVGVGPFTSRAAIYRAAKRGQVPTVEVNGKKFTSEQMILTALTKGLAPSTRPTHATRLERMEAELADL